VKPEVYIIADVGPVSSCHSNTGSGPYTWNHQPTWWQISSVFMI